MNINDRVLVNIENGIATVTLNRPDKYNGLDMPMFHAITKAAKMLRKNREVRAVILHGAGNGFSSGLDMGSIMKKNTNALRLLMKFPLFQPSNLAQKVSYLWRTLPVPVIAVIHGKCYGGGLQIAMGADFRYAMPDAELSIMEAKWGLSPDMGGLLAWRENVRGDYLRELIYTGRCIGTEEALDKGLITHIDEDPMRAAQTFAESLLERSPDAVAAGKHLVNRMLEKSNGGVLKMESRTQWRIIGRYNHMALAKAIMKKSTAQFRSRKRWWCFKG